MAASTTSAPKTLDPAALEVVIYPSPVLKKRALEVARIDPWLQAVVERMKVLMIQQEGVGLAAPQVGLSLRFFVWSPTGKLEDARALINPVLSQERGEEEMEEGCLSLPELRAKIVRYQAIRVEGLDEQGRPVVLDLTEFPARIVQHETDHLDGILILDRMSPVAKLANRKLIKALEERSPVKKR